MVVVYIAICFILSFVFTAFSLKYDSLLVYPAVIRALQENDVSILGQIVAVISLTLLLSPAIVMAVILNCSIAIAIDIPIAFCKIFKRR